MNIVAIALFIIMAVILIKFKLVCEVTVSGEKLGKITKINKDQVKMIDEKGVEITFSSLKDIQVKEKQEVKQGDVIATYQQKFRMTFRYLGKNITYQEYLGM